MKKLSVIVPIYNEESIIEELYSRLKKVLLSITENYEILFINDGSQDQSIQLLKKLSTQDLKTNYINFSRNFGHQIAVTAGLNYCNGEAIVIIDGDLQDPPELIPEMYQKYLEGFEVVYAQRRTRSGETWFKKMSAKLFYRILAQATSFKIPLDSGDFRLIDRKIVEYLNQMPEQNKFIRGQIAWLGFNQTAVLYDREKRKSGKSHYPFKKMVKLATDAITSFSDKPLQLVTSLGIIISITSFIIIFYATMAHYFLNNTITGWTSLIISSMFIGGVQLLSIGIIGEYISRINSNTLNRPLYIISDTSIKTKDKPKLDSPE